ncbi:MAG: hypothetical protein AAF291_08520 [Pseudomonadota bacterium]
MMSEASFASLGPTLLARKGGAKPAMRPQLTPLPDDLSEMAALAEEQLEDLGWNDMGADTDGENVARTQAETPAPLLSTKPSTGKVQDVAQDTQSSADVVPLNAHKDRRTAANEDTLDPLDADGPVVRSQQKRLARRVLADANAAPATGSKAATKSAKPRTKTGRRAAFTLRLDTERHLKLRLAATMKGVSAQSLVTEALDAMLSRIEELDTLVERMKPE